MDRNNFIEGMDLNGDHDLSLCDGFVHGKHHHTPFLWMGFLMQIFFLGLCTQTYVILW